MCLLKQGRSQYKTKHVSQKAIFDDMKKALSNFRNLGVLGWTLIPNELDTWLLSLPEKRFYIFQIQKM